MLGRRTAQIEFERFADHRLDDPVALRLYAREQGRELGCVRGAEGFETQAGRPEVLVAPGLRPKGTTGRRRL
jgi:hypothetical protein